MIGISHKIKKSKFLISWEHAGSKIKYLKPLKIKTHVGSMAAARLVLEKTVLTLVGAPVLLETEDMFNEGSLESAPLARTRFAPAP